MISENSQPGVATPNLPGMEELVKPFKFNSQPYEYKIDFTPEAEPPPYRRGRRNQVLVSLGLGLSAMYGAGFLSQLAAA